MTNLEVLQAGIEFTRNKHASSYPTSSETEALSYSSSMLISVLLKEKNQWATAYTRKNNLRDNMLVLTKEDIKNELLKNMINVAAYNRQINSRASMYLGTEFCLNEMTNDAIAVVSANNIAVTDSLAINLNHELDVYYARNSSQVMRGSK